jgi:uncharacterized membrane protein
MIKSQTVKNKKGYEFSIILRSIFLRILIVVFIIMIYYYFSELFGSISAQFTKEEPKFTVLFSFPLYFLVFFSFLAGPLYGIISGFLGELLFQISFYTAIYPQWILIVSLLGLISGIYKYKPKKYLQGTKLYYAFVILIIQTFGIMVLIVVFQIIVNPIQNLEHIFINYGFTYFIESLLSTVFLVPISLFIYDRIFSKEERHFYNLFLTHHPVYASDHTFYLKFGTTYIYFCSRCSGVVLGSILTIFIFHILELGFNFVLSPGLAIILCVILPLPGLVDWGTQRLLKRKSDTKLRLFTGFLIGIALNAMTYADEYYFFILSLTTFYFFLLFLMMYIGHKKEQKELEEESKKFYEEEI